MTMKIVSLFSGAGGLDLGLQWAGHQVVWANDIWPVAAEIYDANIEDAQITVGDMNPCAQRLLQLSSPVNGFRNHQARIENRLLQIKSTPAAGSSFVARIFGNNG